MWATNGKDWAEKRGFRDALERMIGMIELEAMLCIVGDFNAHVGAAEQGEEECFGKFGWEKRNREGRELMELVARNGMAIARSFFQKRESHNITDRSGHYRTELDLVVVRKRQLWRVKDCKAVAGEHVTTQHKLVVFVVWMEKRRKVQSRCRKIIRWGKCRGNAVVEYKERMRATSSRSRRFEGGVEEVWRGV